MTGPKRAYADISERAALGELPHRRRPCVERRDWSWARSIWIPPAVVLISGCSFGSDSQETGAERVRVELAPVERLLLDQSDDASISMIAHGSSLLAFAPSGEVAVLDPGGRRVILFDRSGSLLRWAGREGAGPGEFRVFLGLGWDPEGRLWVSDDQRITVLDRPGRPSPLPGARVHSLLPAIVPDHVPIPGSLSPDWGVA